jgi:emp24/gp25L/p24 family/GOLD
MLNPCPLASMYMASFTSEMRQLVRPSILLRVSHGLFIIYLEVVAPIEREIRTLAHGLTSVKDEQEYIVIREKTHRNTAESTNSRVKWWSILQAVVLFSVVAWQVYYLKVTIPSHQRYFGIDTFISPSSRLRGSYKIIVVFRTCCTHTLKTRACFIYNH